MGNVQRDQRTNKVDRGEKARRSMTKAEKITWAVAVGIAASCWIGCGSVSGEYSVTVESRIDYDDGSCDIATDIGEFYMCGEVDGECHPAYCAYFASGRQYSIVVEDSRIVDALMYEGAL